MSARRTLLVFLKGLAMGAADSVPGVSGGTIAFITHIYDELLDAIKALNPGTLRLLFAGHFGAAWQAINGKFLLPLLSGILLALVASAHLVVWLLEYRYSYLMCFFNGLILASLWMVARELPAWTPTRLVLLLLGAGFAVALALLPPAPGADSLLYYFLCGAVAICAMILPGISGAFILLLLGAYEPVLQALLGLDLPIVLVFALGCLVGLLSFARLLSWLLHTRRAATLATLLGILTGSLYSLWPWRHLVACEGAACSAQSLTHYRNALPAAVDIVTGTPLSLLLCMLLLAGGAALVLGLEWLARKFGNKSNSSTPSA